MRDRFLRALRREPVDRPPLWIMRQAGRYLPEYRALRERHGILEICRTPELAVEASLQPLRRFDLDAAIVFSDIMVPLAALGCAIAFTPGPHLEPLRARAAIEALRPRPMAEVVPYVGEAVRLLRRELDGRVPVIGFCGAPFTLAAYLVEGHGSDDFAAVRTLAYREPETLALLLGTLADAMADYLNLQIRAGAQAVQLFDSWAGLLAPAEYRALALPALRRLVSGLERDGVPVIYFAVGAGHLLEAALETGADALGVCWRTPIEDARRRVGARVALQGNLDPHVLLAPPEVVRARAADLLARAGAAPGYVANLGHGILPDTPIESVEALLETVKGWPGEGTNGNPDDGFAEASHEARDGGRESAR